MTFYAHTRKDQPTTEWQTLLAHLTNTSNLAAELGRDAGVSELAQTAAFLHDLGKYSAAFQQRLQGASIRVVHSTAGAQEARRLFCEGQMQQWLATLLAYCVAGHHAGLPDYGSVTDTENEGTLLARLKLNLQDYSAYQSEIPVERLTLPKRIKIRPLKIEKQDYTRFSLAFLTRMIYSALVDADFIETETFVQGTKPRGGYADIAELCKKLDLYLAQFDHPQNAINQKRTETLRACMAKADEKPGFFTLTVPTGGGKTLASLAFALHHALSHGLKRIIYVIPFTSIIEQNAAIFKLCLGEENVLEHHSNFDWEEHRERIRASAPDDQTNQAENKLKLAAENWDIPIVVTTNVQFFESLYASRSSRCRKLHNIAKSVIIFDEAQMLPTGYLKPCLYAVAELVGNYGASAVFCTATQPALQHFLPGFEFRELAPHPHDLFYFYRRTQIQSVGRMNDEQLCDRMMTENQVLCIVNTRRHAKGLFDLLSQSCSGDVFHLSTLMCPEHRKSVLKEIRQRLKDGEPCRVISTQVMEAGIDVDFPVGYRSLAGLDSVIQAAGRVNREGRSAQPGQVYVFEPDSDLAKRMPAFIRQTADVTRQVLRDFSEDPASLDGIAAYFQSLYNLQGSHAYDERHILLHFEKGTDELDFDFRSAAERFHLIDHNTVPLIIVYDERANRLLEALRNSPYPASFARKLQLYTINIYEQEMQALQSQGKVLTYADRYAVLADLSQYNPDSGLTIPQSGQGDAFFI